MAAALAALADGPSRLTGIGHMRRHETDRLAALAAEIGALGGDVTELPDGLAIRPRPLRAGGRPFASYDDHRMVMAAAVLGLAVPGIEVANAATVARPSPASRELWASMLEQRCPDPAREARDLDEDDVRVRPGRGSRPRTRRRPAHEDAVEGFVAAVDRGRYGVLGRRTAWSPRCGQGTGPPGRGRR